MIQIADRVALPANRTLASTLDVLVCTSGNYHLLDSLQLPANFLHRCPADVEPRFLGFACQAALRERLGQYDMYCYLEDDLVITDPLFLTKAAWFANSGPSGALLLPNRFEVASRGVVRKAYVDGDLRPELTNQFQDIDQQSGMRRRFLNISFRFRRPLNPHSGCYFLTGEQLAEWAKKPYFSKPDTSFIGPFESAATLGIMKTFRIYKPAPENAAFLEIQHSGTAFLSRIGLVLLRDE